MAAQSNNFASYATYYSSPDVDVLRENYERVLAVFDVNATATPEALLSQAVGSVSIPQVFVILAVNHQNMPRVYTLHRPSKITAPLGGTSPWDGQIFATNGDVQGNLVNTVRFPDDAFELCAPVRVPSAEYINEYFSNHPAAEFVGPFAADEANTEEIQTRFSMYLPTFLAPHFLNVQGVTPRRFWEVAMPLLQAENKIDECDLFIDWMRVSLTVTPRRVRQNNVNVVILTRPVLTVPLVDMELFQAREIIINNDLRGRYSQGIGFQDSVLRLAAAVADNTNKTVALAAEDKDRKPSKVWPQTIELLMKYTCVANEQDLPDLYIALAKAAKHERRMVIQQALSVYCNSAAAFCMQPLVVNLTIAKCIQEFDFVALDPDILSLGLQPFILNIGNAEQRAKTLEIATQFDALEGSKIGVTLQDLKDLSATEVKHVPLTFMETEQTLGSFGDLLAVTLGVNHVLFVAYSAFWKEWSRARPFLSNAIDVARLLKPVHILRRIQLELFYWFNSKRQNTVPRTVDFTLLLHEIHMATFTPPALPPHMFGASLAFPTATVPALTAASDTTSVSPSLLSDLSSLTGLLLASQATLPTKKTNAGSGDAVLNPSPDPELDAALAGHKIKSVCKPPYPTNLGGVEMCIAYHSKGRCYTKCNRAADHKPHSTEEQVMLRSYVEAQVKQNKRDTTTRSQRQTTTPGAGVPP